MATYIVDSTGAIPGSYTNHALATAAAVAAADPAAIISTQRAGVYAGQVIAGKTLTGASYVDTVGGDYTIGLDTAVIAAWEPGPATTMTGGSIRGGGSDSLRLDTGCTFFGSGVEWQIVDPGYGYGCRLLGAGATLRLLNSKITTGGVGTVSLGAVVRMRPGAVASAVHFDNVGVTADVDCSLGCVYAWQGSPTITMIASGYASNDTARYLVNIAPGLTVPLITAYGSHGRSLVSSSAPVTISSFVGGHNCYRYTLSGTSSATDAPDIEDRRLGGVDGLTPLHDSPLRDVIPAGTAYGATDSDMYGNPRYRGGRQCVGPVQPQDQRMPLPVRLAAGM